MVNTRFKPATPGKAIHELRKQMRAVQREDPGPERAATLAPLIRRAHELRQLNMAMHAGALCLDEDPEAPNLLVDAYLDGVDDPEERLRALIDLQDLARYLDRGALEDDATNQIREDARRWASEVEDPERRHRLRTLASMVSQEFADSIRDELRFG